MIWRPATGVVRVPQLSRRGFIKTSTATALTLTGAGSLASCAAGAAAGGEAAEDAVVNPAGWDWLEQIGKSVAATLVGDAIDKGLSGFFSSWNTNVQNTVSDQTTKAPFNLVYQDYWVHTVPPVVLVGVTQKNSNPLTDKMLACVNEGNDPVLFEPWAWQALSMFIQGLTSGKTGADLAGFQALCLISLIPSGTAPRSGSSPEDSVAWMTYATRNGTVEISQQQQADGAYNATVRATGIPNASYEPTVKQYTLPTQIASS
jgi:hypothetical protein